MYNYDELMGNKSSKEKKPTKRMRQTNELSTVRLTNALSAIVTVGDTLKSRLHALKNIQNLKASFEQEGCQRASMAFVKGNGELMSLESFKALANMPATGYLPTNGRVIRAVEDLAVAEQITNTAAATALTYAAEKLDVLFDALEDKAEQISDRINDVTFELSEVNDEALGEYRLIGISADALVSKLRIISEVLNSLVVTSSHDDESILAAITSAVNGLTEVCGVQIDDDQITVNHSLIAEQYQAREASLAELGYTSDVLTTEVLPAAASAVAAVETLVEYRDAIIERLEGAVADIEAATEALTKTSSLESLRTETELFAKQNRKMMMAYLEGEVPAPSEGTGDGQSAEEVAPSRLCCRYLAVLVIAIEAANLATIEALTAAELAVATDDDSYGGDEYAEMKHVNVPNQPEVHKNKK